MGGRRIVFLVLMGVGIYGIWAALQMPVGKIQDQGPGLFPLVLSGLLLSLSSLSLIFSKEEKGAPLDWKKIWGESRIPLRIVLLTLGAIYFWESLGFLIACPLFLFLLFFWASGYRLWKALAFGLAGGLIGWAFFIKLLGVAMPVGFLGF
jgi:hypothetical protein